MNWCKDNIATAVSLSKTKNAIFVVYIEGKDEATVKLGSFINDKRIREKFESDDFVAIKIDGQSESYIQFARIFQVVPIPSIFFIGQAGKPLDIATGVIKSVEQLEDKIIKVLQLAGKKTNTDDILCEESNASSSNDVAEESKEVVSTEPIAEVLCKSKNLTEENNETKSQSTVQEDDAKLSEMRKRLEQKRCERIEEEKRLEKERELKRREEQKNVQNVHNWQKDQEFKELKENLKRERMEEQVARERIRAQIAADKVERAHKFSVENQSTSARVTENVNTTKQENVKTATASDVSRLQFRLASGASNSCNFECSTTLSEIRDYVTHDLLPGTGIKEFTLATTYPKRELTSEFNTKTLLELELFPSAVILIIGKEATGPAAIISRNGGMLNILSIMIMSIWHPILSLFTTAKNWFTGGENRNESAQSGAQKRSYQEQNQQNEPKRRNFSESLSSGKPTGYTNQDKGDISSGSSQSNAYRRYAGSSNIHRLSDNRKDSDDENATWNGNSTQQQ